MGMYINKGNNGFRMIRNSEYVDKSGLINVINRTLFTEWRFSCITRCRRFGKSMAAKMLAAYYDCTCDSRELFADLEIAKDPSFEKHLNKYRVIYLDMTDFITKFKDGSIVRHIDEELKKEAKKLIREGKFIQSLYFKGDAGLKRTLYFFINQYHYIKKYKESFGNKGLR